MKTNKPNVHGRGSIKNHLCPLLATALVVAANVMSAASTQSMDVPVITIQPVKQTVDFGSDAAFTVVATGGPLTYQWQRNGNNLYDYGNVAGSSTPTLYLTGVSEGDVSKYEVVVANAGGSVTSSVVPLSVRSEIVFSDNFESGLGNWNPLLDSSSLSLDNSQNHTPGGSQSLYLTNSCQGMYHSLDRINGRVRLTAWFYDDGSALPAYAELRGYSGPEGYGKYVPPRGLVQLFAIGRRGANSSGDNAGESVDPNYYQGRVFAGTNAGWFNLNASNAPTRSVGWHRLQIEQEFPGTTVRFMVDNVVAGVIRGVAPAALDTVVIGCPNAEAGTGRAWFDDVAVAAYPAKFDYQDYDSTGKNLFPDWMKLRETGTNADVLNVTPSTVYEVTGATTNGGLGNWASDGVGIYATGLRGCLEYTLSAPAANAYRIEIEGRERSYLAPAVELPLNIFFDHEFLGRFNMPYSSASNGFVHCFTPFIQPGSHTLRVQWDNCAPRRSFYAQAVRLQSLSGPDVARNGMAMWVARRLWAQSSVTFAPTSSPVSPVCVEGREHYLSMMSMVVGTAYPLSSIPVNHGAGYRWYANVPLSPTNVTRVETSFQNGAFTETNDITWQATDLLEATNALIRVGDSLLFTVLPTGASNGPMTINVQGSETYSTDASTPIPYQFSQAGTFTVSGTYQSSGATGSITVTVVGASLDEHRAAFINKAGGAYWACTNLPPGTVIDGDPRLKLHALSAAEKNQLDPTLPAAGNNERDYLLIDNSTEPYYVLARLGTNGPVLARTVVQGFRWLMPPETLLRIAQYNNDGSQLIQGTFVMSPVLPTVSVSFEIHTSGVTFDDGTVTKTLLPSAFDTLGVCTLNFIRGAGVESSVCNVSKVYDDGVMIGWK